MIFILKEGTHYINWYNDVYYIEKNNRYYKTSYTDGIKTVKRISKKDFLNAYEIYKKNQK